MNRETRTYLLGIATGIAMIALMFALGMIKMKYDLVREHQAEIVQRGFGEYYVNTNTVPPSVEFRWKE